MKAIIEATPEIWKQNDVKGKSLFWFLCFILYFLNLNRYFDQLVGRVANDTTIGAGGYGSISRPVKLDTVLPPLQYRLEWCCPGAKPRRWTPPLVTRFLIIGYCKYNEDLIWFTDLQYRFIAHNKTIFSNVFVLDIEGIMNSVLSLMFVIPANKGEELVKLLCEKLRLGIDSGKHAVSLKAYVLILSEAWWKFCWSPAE